MLSDVSMWVLVWIVAMILAMTLNSTYLWRFSKGLFAQSCCDACFGAWLIFALTYCLCNVCLKGLFIVETVLNGECYILSSYFTLSIFHQILLFLPVVVSICATFEGWQVWMRQPPLHLPSLINVGKTACHIGYCLLRCNYFLYCEEGLVP